MSRRVYLNPCDYFFYGQHLELTRKSAEGNIAFMILDLDGQLEPAAFQQALARALAAHPALMGRLRITVPRGRPYWKTPPELERAAQQAATAAHAFHDFRSVADWQDRVNRLYPTGAATRWNHREGPQVRLDAFHLPENRTRIIFRWPHFLMDADGAQWFLHQLARDYPSQLPDSLTPDHCTIDALGKRTFMERVDLVRRGFSMSRHHQSIKSEPLFKAPLRPMASHRVIHRHWDAQQVRILQDAAKRVAPPGPALYARYFAACVLRAIDRLSAETGVNSEAYTITMPLRVGMSRPFDDLFQKRPIPGNYLVSPVLAARKDHVRDHAALGHDLLVQIQDYTRHQCDVMQWSLMWAASYIHKWSYRFIFKLPIDIVAFSSGFSYYGEISQPVRSLCGCRVSNLWGGGPTTTPPALNPVFSRFASRLNLCLTYDHQVVSDEQAARYVSLIEDEMFEPAEELDTAVEEL